MVFKTSVVYMGIVLIIASISAFAIIRESSSIKGLGVNDLNYPIKHIEKAPKMVMVKSYSLSVTQLQNEALIASEFSDVPIMVKVLGCESSFNQFDDSGSVLTSPTNDVGLSQINVKDWGDKAQELGLDIYNSVSDNLKMARYVYNSQGLSAWVCYNKVR